jgi:mono/diheme cytochrome c family protein
MVSSILLALFLMASWITIPSSQSAADEYFSSPHVPQEQDGARLLAARCAVCHSTDLIQQQRLDRDRWGATVKKMVHWGALLSPGEEIVLVEYLANHFHPGVGTEPQAAALPEPATKRDRASHPVGVGSRGEGLYRQNCLPCHGDAGAGGVGPKLAKNTILTQEDSFWTTVTNGRGAMPAWGLVLQPQEIADIQAWLKTVRD